MFEQATEIFRGAQTEIAIFVIAFFLHALVFGRHRVPDRKSLPAAQGKRAQGPSPDKPKADVSSQPDPKLAEGDLLGESSAMGQLKKLAASSGIDDAWEVFEACSPKSTSLYNAMLDVCVNCRAIRDAETVMRAAAEAGLADVVTYNTLVKAHLQEGSSKEARKVIDAMRKAGLRPNIVTFNELVDAAIKISIEAAWGVVDEMPACGVKPNRITCSILLKSIQQSSSQANVARILTVLEDMDDEADEVLLSSAIEACIRVDRRDLLVPYLQRQCSSRKIPVKNPHTLGSLIRAYGFVGDLGSVWDTWRDMSKRHIMPTSITLGCMVEALTSNGDVDASYDLLHEMLSDEQCKTLVNAVVYGSVLKGFSHQKRFDRVWSLYQEMLELKLQFSLVTFNTIMDACARSGEMAQIPPLLDSMMAQGIQPNRISYSIVIKGYCQENKFEEALQVWESMLQTTSLQPDEIMYNTILDGCARKGLLERGTKLLEEMQRSGIRPSNFTLSVLVKMASRAKQLDRAFELCQELSEKYKFRLNVHVFSNLVQACIANNAMPRAFDVLDQMVRERVRPDLRTYSLLIKACIAAGKGKDVSGLVRAALGLQDAHPSLSSAGSWAQVPKGLPSDLLVEVLEGLSGPCRDNWLAVYLLKDIKHLPYLKLPAGLQLRLTNQAFQS